tara:strand:- start:2420 stop:3208 length:789 start_codon:yes stop_codon:yes gene_type:complete
MNFKVMLFVNARDEPSIKEWIIHHLLLGFYHIVVFDHKSKIPISKLGTFNNRVTHIYTSMPDGNIKIKLIKNALEITKKYIIDWMLYLDADEFLYLGNFNSVNHLLTKFYFADAVSLNWLMFGSSQHKKQPSGLITENFIHSDPVLNKHVKTFIRPNAVIRCTNPHCYDLIVPQNAYHISGMKMIPGSPFFQINRPFEKSYAYIAHYLIQSEEEFYRRKGRRMDDGSKNKSSLYKNVHEHHNSSLNTQLRDKYSNNIKKHFF